ncbi:ABC-type cobalamin/Fe3+-siderophore transport system, ATPase component [Desulfitobacterium dichloroeliminans LMG P-21439]|uniref:ABC-type cobalamin/Fe3+-siderophore transport system, ATPase component n=1 Tax=Desulfitobacterium dichloroeliminans (strain LMG P-21439 / DCA1) TaxID=871963 RepID=L0F9R6_DESDL|nr:ABC-type cobalamin/Fe3+-siderophore transport system, ATPase component [Desulfitobacterium dichloroeliminans LMG P-21439]
MNLYKIQDLNQHYGELAVLQDLSFTIGQGDMFGIIGPNGSGKSTLISTISGILPPTSGSILLNGRPLSSYSAKELALQIAVLEQDGTPALPFTVEQVVSMGRFPWLKPFSDLGPQDKAVVENILRKLNLWTKRSQKISTLSGGQRQLVSLARAMAQEPQVLILDEPTTYLDIGHQLLVMDHVRQWHVELGITIIMVLHDLNITGQYCDYVLLLDQGKIVTWGKKDEVMSAEVLTQVYKADLVQVHHPKLGVPQFLLSGK